MDRARQVLGLGPLFVAVLVQSYACGAGSSPETTPAQFSTPDGAPVLGDATEGGTEAGPHADSGTAPDVSRGDATSDATSIENSASDAAVLEAATPLPHCSAAPSPGGQCSMSANPPCTLGGFGCFCDCNCVSGQGGPPTCRGPCLWTCNFDGDPQLVTGNVSVSLNCSDASTPAFSISAPVQYRALADGPSLTIDNISPPTTYLELSKQGKAGSVPCALDVPMVPAPIGPIASGSSQSVTESIGPAPCSGTYPHVDACSYCDGTASVSSA